MTQTCITDSKFTQGFHRKFSMMLLKGRLDILKPSIWKKAKEFARRFPHVLSPLVKRSLNLDHSHPLETDDDWIIYAKNGLSRSHILMSSLRGASGSSASCHCQNTDELCFPAPSESHFHFLDPYCLRSEYLQPNGMYLERFPAALSCNTLEGLKRPVI